jgi:hypothetical protein
MLKKPASGVLASLRGSTYRSVRLASSLAAALLSGLFEHPARYSPVVLDMREKRDVNRLDSHLVSPVLPVSLGCPAGAL